MSINETAGNLPCGGTSYVDPESSFHASVCLDCLCVIGSMSMPAECRRLLDERDTVNAG